MKNIQNVFSLFQSNMACSPLQVTAACFDLDGSCVGTCGNKIDPDCRDARMYGYVRDCQSPSLPFPQINEGWNSPAKQSISSKMIIIVILFVLICILGYLHFQRRK